MLRADDRLPHSRKTFANRRIAKDGMMKILAESLPRSRLSVAMIVRDEQDVLAESIEAVGKIADEIVVLDTGSTDRTPELAAELGAKVYRLPWSNDFSTARNHCLKLVTGNWVLWLDAGERLCSSQGAELRRFIDENASTVLAYSVWVETPPSDGAASAEQCAQIRLHPTHPDLHFLGRVRETLSDSLQATGIQTADSAFRIIRHLRHHDVERSLNKAQRDLALANAEADGSGKWSPRLLLAAGEAHCMLGDQDQARDLLRQAAKTSQPRSAERLEAFYGLLTTFDEDPELHASQLTACLDSLEDFPFDMQLLLALGNYMMVRERLDLAIRAFEAAVRFGRITPTVWHLSEVREIAAVCLGMALQARQRDDEASDILETALTAKPDSLRLLNQLHLLFVKLGKTGAAAALAERLTALLPETAADRGSSQSGRVQRRLDSGSPSRDLALHISARSPQRIAE
jgi:tetratricopeptide (TPR) repeat protein